MPKPIIRLGPNISGLGNMKSFEYEDTIALPFGLGETPNIIFKHYGVAQGDIASAITGSSLEDVAKSITDQLGPDEITRRAGGKAWHRSETERAALQREEVYKEELRVLKDKVGRFKRAMQDGAISLANQFGRSESEHGAGFGFGIITPVNQRYSSPEISGGIMHDDGSIHTFRFMKNQRGKVSICNLDRIDGAEALVYAHELTSWNRYIHSEKKTADKKSFLNDQYVPE